MLKLYLLSQTVNTEWDTYDSCVVACEDPAAAKKIHPSTYKTGEWWNDHSCWDWTHDFDSITCEYLGDAVDGIEPGVICSSFNAG